MNNLSSLSSFVCYILPLKQFHSSLHEHLNTMKIEAKTNSDLEQLTFPKLLFTKFKEFVTRPIFDLPTNAEITVF